MAEMPESVKQILSDVEYFEDTYFAFDEPVPFAGLQLYPVKVKQYNEFMRCCQCLTLNKNDDIKGIRMTHIDYLVDKMQDEKEGVMWSMMFTKIVELCLHVQSGLKCPKCGKFIPIEDFIKSMSEAKTDEEKKNLLFCECGEKLHETIGYKTGKNGKKCFCIDGIEIDSKQFNSIRNYIMYQNIPGYKDDSWVEKSIRDDQALAAQMRNRDSGTATLERKMVGVSVNMNMPIGEIQDMTVRKFLLTLNMIEDIMSYKIVRTGLASGFASLPKGEKVEHWLYKPKKGLYDKAVSADSYAKQLKPFT